MKDKITVNIGTDHSYDCKTDVIGRAGEGNVTQMEFKIPSKLCSCSFYLDFEKPNGETYRTPKLPINDGVATYNVQPFVLTDSGEIKVQAVLEKASGEVWKSDIKMYINRKSINVSEDVDGYIVPSGSMTIINNGTYDVKSFASVLVKVEKRYLRGTWKIDPSKLTTTSIMTEANVNFKIPAGEIDGDNFDKITWSNGILSYFRQGTSYTVFEYYFYASEGRTWIYNGITGDPSTLKFGSTEQEVSAEFYAWFEGVAEKIGDEDIPEGYIKPSGEIKITENNKTFDVAEFASARIEVPTGSGGEANLGGITVTPTEDTQNILATDKGLDGFDEVIVEPIPDEYIIPSGTLPITENGLRTLQKDDGGYYDSVNVNVPSVEPTLITPPTITENGTYIANNYNADGFASVEVNVESSGGGGAELNIAYGDTAPEDTSKLWVKTAEPSAVKVSGAISQTGSGETIETLTGVLPTTFSKGAVAEAGNKIYTFAGSHGGSKSNKILCFDTETETTTTLITTMTAKYELCSATTAGDKIYIIGGNNSYVFDTVFCFDTATQTISNLNIKFPSSTQDNAVAYVNGYLYIFGDANGNDVIKVDIEAGTAIKLDEIPSTDNDFKRPASQVIGESIYLFGGDRTMGITQSYENIWRYDTTTDTFTLLAEKLPYKAGDIASGIRGSLIYLFGGTPYVQGTTHNSILCFDTVTEKLTSYRGTLPVPLRGFEAGVTVGDYIYLVGCETANILKFTNNLLLPLETDKMHIVSANSNKFNLINTNTAQVEIGVKKVYKGNTDGIAEEVEASLHNGTSWVTI